VVLPGVVLGMATVLGYILRYLVFQRSERRRNPPP